MGRPARFRAGTGRRPKPRDPGSGDTRARVGAHRDAPGPPGHGLRARPLEPERPGRGTHRARPRRRVAEGRRDDPRRRRRGRDRGDDGAGRGRIAVPRAARAADDGGGGGRARGRERARPDARHGHDPRQPRQRGGRPADGRLRRKHGHVGADRCSARGCSSPGRSAVRHGRRRPGRTLGIGHRTGPLECGQGPRSCAARGAREGALPPRLAERRQEPQRDPARRIRGDLGRARERERRFARRSRPRARRFATRSRRPTRVSRSRSRPRRQASSRGPTTRPRACWTRSHSCPRGRSP